MGPFKVLARSTPNTYCLELPAAWRAFDNFNVERLRPYRHRLTEGPAAGPRPIIQELLKFKLRYGRPNLLVRWAGHDASGDTREPLDSLKDCAEAISGFERASGRVLPRHSPPPPAAAAAPPPPPPPISPTGFTADSTPPDDLGAAVVGRTLLYWRPEDGWKRCTGGSASARRFLTCRGVYAADVGAARHGGLAARRGVLPHPLGAFVSGLGRPGPPVSGYPALTFSLVGGS